MLSRKLLDLHLSQASTALQKARSFSYSDKHKENYHRKLDELFKKISDEINTKNPTLDTDVFIYKKHLDFIFKSLEFLGSSTLNLIPFEIVECLNHALNDWIDRGSESFIIVTSLINNIQGFSFDPTLAFNDAIYTEIDTRYSLTFEKRLIQINLPRTLSRDYLTAVVLYHELGHFIDYKLSIVESLKIDLRTQYYAGTLAGTLADIKQFIPFFEDVLGTNDEIAIAYHLSEYYCDLFASQYVGESSSHFLSYLTENSPNYGISHPSTVNRVKVVSDFLNGTNNIIVNLISEAIIKITGKPLEKRYEVINSDDFYKLLPIEIDNSKKLHGIFEYAWKIWLDINGELSQKIELSDINTERIYSIVNNLTEKSISNYIINEKWKIATTP